MKRSVKTHAETENDQKAVNDLVENIFENSSKETYDVEVPKHSENKEPLGSYFDREDFMVEVEGRNDFKDKKVMEAGTWKSPKKQRKEFNDEHLNQTTALEEK